MTKWMVQLAVVASLVGLLVVVPGCGSGSDSTTMGKADFVRQAAAICQKSEQERGEVFARVSEEFAGKRVTPRVREKAVLQLVEPYALQTERLAGLDLPEGEEKKVEAMLAAMEHAVAQAKASPGSLISSTAVFKKPDNLAEEYGLKHCSF